MSPESFSGTKTGKGPRSCIVANHASGDTARRSPSRRPSDNLQLSNKNTSPVSPGQSHTHCDEGAGGFTRIANSSGGIKERCLSLLRTFCFDCCCRPEADHIVRPATCGRISAVDAWKRSSPTLDASGSNRKSHTSLTPKCKALQGDSDVQMVHDWLC